MRKVIIQTNDRGQVDITSLCPRFFDRLMGDATFDTLQEAEHMLEVFRKYNTGFKLERGGKVTDEERDCLRRVLEVQKTKPKKGGKRK